MVKKGRRLARRYVRTKEHMDSCRRNCSDGATISPRGHYALRRTPRYGGKTSRGVFAKICFSKGELLGEYRGGVDTKGQGVLRMTRISKYALDVMVDGTYMYTILGNNPEKSGWPRYINRPNRGEKCNVAFVLYEYPEYQRKTADQYRVMVQAVRDIRPGEQLLVSYKA